MSLPKTRNAIRSTLLVSAGVLLASCASKPPPTKHSKEYFPESVYGVKASPRVVEYGQPVPQGGGRYMVGKAYTVKGRVYTPFEGKRYVAVGYASWYGSAFHGRRTANGEVYDMDSLSAAHPTMPLPSYARVTNLKNGASVIVRVNDRGPYERDRLIDLSAKTAELLMVRRHGAVKVKVEYVGPARMEGHDYNMLMASYVPPKGGLPASEPVAGNTMFASNAPVRQPVVQPALQPAAPVLVAMMPLPRARPELDDGIAIDPSTYEIQLAAQESAPRAAPAAAAPEPVLAASEPQGIVAEPQVIEASASGESYPDGGTSYGERTLGTYTISGSASRSYAEAPALSPAQIALEAMAAPGEPKLQAALEKAVERRAAERSADLVEIQVGVYRSAANAAAIGGKVKSLGTLRYLDVTVGGQPMRAVRLLVDPSESGGDALKAVAAAGAPGAYIVR